MRNKNLSTGQAALLAFGLPALLVALLPICALLASASPATILEYLRDDLTLKALKLSVVSSLIATGLVLLFGTPLAFVLARVPHGKAQRILGGVLSLTLFTPPAVAGLGLLLAFGQHGFLGQLLSKSGLPVLGMAAVVLAQCFVASPHYIKSAAASLASVPAVLKEAALMEGASRFQIFQHVTLPLAWRGVLAGVAMAWVRGLGEFGATLIFAGNLPGRTQTLPLGILSNFEASGPRALVMAVALLLISFALLLVIQALSPKRADQMAP